MGGEFVAALGDEVFDQVRFSLGQKFFHFVGRDLVFAEFFRELEDLAVVLIGLARSKSEAVIFFVCPNPKPGDDITLAQTDRAIMVADANNADLVSPLFKAKRWMPRV